MTILYWVAQDGATLTEGDVKKPHENVKLLGTGYKTKPAHFQIYKVADPLSAMLLRRRNRPTKTPFPPPHLVVDWAAGRATSGMVKLPRRRFQLPLLLTFEDDMGNPSYNIRVSALGTIRFRGGFRRGPVQGSAEYEMKLAKDPSVSLAALVPGQPEWDEVLDEMAEDLHGDLGESKESLASEIRHELPSEMPKDWTFSVEPSQFKADEGTVVPVSLVFSAPTSGTGAFIIQATLPDGDARTISHIALLDVEDPALPAMIRFS